MELNEIVARKYILVKYFQGEPQKSDVEIVKEVLPPLKNGEYLCKAEYWSVDPYMRVYMSRYPLNSVMTGRQVARIIVSNNKKFPIGSRVLGNFGWRDFTIAGGPDENPEYVPKLLTEDYDDFHPSLALGILGRPGNTAYFGFLELCQPKDGETVVVTGAAGAVGSLVGQIAKIKGCRVIGFAGTDFKCNWLKNKLGFDYAFNYRTVNVSKALKEAAPNGIDCYFDNVGGELSSVVIHQMNRFGRISVCGSISQYNSDVLELSRATTIQQKFVFSELKMEGFIVSRWTDRFDEGIRQMMKWVKEEKIRNEETVTEGFEHMFDAFLGMMRGENRGKAIIKA